MFGMSFGAFIMMGIISTTTAESTSPAARCWKAHVTLSETWSP